MKTLKYFALACVAVLGFGALQAQADTNWHDQTTPHHLLAYKDYLNQLDAEQRFDLHHYMQYEYHREPCQNYREVPRGFVRKDCQLYLKSKPPVPREEPREIVKTYKVYFDFDEASLRPDARNTLDKVAREIKKYNPYEVTVSGHADRAGPSDYNVALSKRRAMSVSEALTARGIENRVITSRARGEFAPAVPTEDGVRLQENRRVVIDFRK